VNLAHNRRFEVERRRLNERLAAWISDANLATPTTLSNYRSYHLVH
jgi:hypothetical protein